MCKATAFCLLQHTSSARKANIACTPGRLLGLSPCERPLSPPAPAKLARASLPPAASAVVAVAAEAAKPTILVAEKLGKGGVDMLKEVSLGARWVLPTRLAGLCPLFSLPQARPATRLVCFRAAAKQVGTVDCTYDMSKEDLLAKISLCDAIVIRSATKVSSGELALSWNRPWSRRTQRRSVHACALHAWRAGGWAPWCLVSQLVDMNGRQACRLRASKEADRPSSLYLTRQEPSACAPPSSPSQLTKIGNKLPLTAGHPHGCGQPSACACPPARFHRPPLHPLQVTREVFEASKGRLKVVGRAGVGIDNVDLAAASEYGCLVVNAPTANTVAAAEHGIALLCALARNVSQADAAMKEGR